VRKKPERGAVDICWRREAEIRESEICVFIVRTKTLMEATIYLSE
jgi:hypothetical protein